MTHNRKTNLSLNFLASPFLLAVPLTIAIIFIIPDLGSKYQLELVGSRSADKEKSKIAFVDLDSDGTDEQVSGFPNISMQKAAIKVMSHDFVNYEQWNFNGEYEKISDYFHCADLNKDGQSEVYTLYHRNDSLFMAAIAPFPDKEILFEDKFIAVFDLIDNEIDYEVKNFKTADLNLDGFEELIFQVNAGFSLQPRKIMAYDAVHNKVLSSETFAANITNIQISDLNNDGYPEIYANTYTRKNIPETSNLPYSDYHSWLMVFDHRLDFMFDPIQHEGAFSKVLTYPVKGFFEKPAILSLFLHKTKRQYMFRKYNLTGELLKEIDLKQVTDISGYHPDLFELNLSMTEKMIIIGFQDNNLLYTDKELHILKLETDIKVSDFLFSEDLNLDGNNEFIFTDARNDLIVFDKNLKNPVRYDFNLLKPSHFYCAGLKSVTNKKEIFVKTDHRVYFLSYSKNPLFYVKFLVWILIYLLITFALWFAQYLRQKQVQKWNELETTITQLQMKTIKNQMDPHFIFNVLNGIANSVYQQHHTESYKQIVRFSRLLRILMERSDVICVTIADELEFVLYYLELEKFRFKHNFSYSINIDEHVDKKYKIPKMLIQLLVENAIKHRLSDKTGVKYIAIRISDPDNSLKIVVEDNGVGRDTARKRNPEKGKGYSLLDELTKLNNELYGRKINMSIEDLYGENKTATGTRVVAILT